MSSFIGLKCTSEGVASFSSCQCHAGVSPDTGLKLQLMQVFVPFGGLGGFILAIVALIRRERYWVLPLGG